MRKIAPNWPLWIALGFYGAATTIMLWVAVQNSDHHLTYAIDDAYIHMAMAKNFSQHGVWGVTPYEFSSSSSSLLWTLTLSIVYFVFGVRESASLILNILCSVLTIGLSYWILKKEAIHSQYIFIILLLLIFLTPLPALNLLGMEHTAQTLFVIGFIYAASRLIALSPEVSISNTRIAFLMILGTLAVAIRYESLFPIAIVCLLLLIRRGRKGIFSVLLIGSAPWLLILIYGLTSVAHGWYFLPNSVLLKGAKIDLSTGFGVASFLGLRAILQMFANPYLFAICLIIFLLLYRQFRQHYVWEHSTIFGIVALVTIFLHVQYAQIGSFYRYEAYLIALAVLAVALMFAKLLAAPKQVSILQLVVATIVLIFIALPAKRAIEALVETPHAMIDVYHQQYQMGLFAKQFYQGETVALSDIGAVNFLADIKLFDFAGLGDMNVAKQFMAKNRELLTEQDINTLSKAANVRIAIVFDGWWVPRPATWHQAGKWITPGNISAMADTVAIYTTNEADLNHLIADLKSFSTQLPAAVIQSGTYMKP